MNFDIDNLSMNLMTIKHILPHFSIDPDQAEVLPLGNGLINHTYKVIDHKAGKSIVLQVVNTIVFKSPEDIQHNYQLIQNFLKKTNSSIRLPDMVQTTTGDNGWWDEQNRFWRAFEFIDNTFSPDLADNTALAHTAAHCFGQLTSELNAIDISNFIEILPRFHDLGLRFEQFEDALHRGNCQRIKKVNPIILELMNRKYILEFFQTMLLDEDGFRLRVMHHDTKVSNILFNKADGKVVCPVDMDTIMPGRFYSDLGDMIRTMACSEDENSTDFGNIYIRREYYLAIMKGYMEVMNSSFTPDEKKHIHFAGLIMIYQQALRFLTDYLLEDVYYKIRYPEHNLDRAKNQLQLLISLEDFLVKEYNLPVRTPAQSIATP